MEVKCLSAHYLLWFSMDLNQICCGNSLHPTRWNTYACLLVNCPKEIIQNRGSILNLRNHMPLICYWARWFGRTTLFWILLDIRIIHQGFPFPADVQYQLPHRRVSYNPHRGNLCSVIRHRWKRGNLGKSTRHGYIVKGHCDC